MRIYGQNEEKRKLNRGGFTTVELIVVVILVMLVSGSLMFGTARWIGNVNFSRQNEYARALFASAQNQLTDYSESGQLEDFCEKIMSGDCYGGTIDKLIKDGKLTGTDGTVYRLETVWPESADKPEPSKYRGEIYSMIGTEADYQEYLSGTADEGTAAFYEMLSVYLYDTSILKGTVCVEFTPEDGQVFSVLYSDKNDGFTYDDVDSRRGTVSILNRENQTRKQRMIGYYGVDTLSKSTTVKKEKPSITKLRLNNGDTLNLSFELKNVTEPQELQYEVRVYDRESRQQQLMFRLDGSKIKQEMFRQTIPCEVTRYIYGADGKAREQKLGIYNILAWVGEGAEVQIVLDGADSGASTRLYQEIYAALTGKSEADPEFGLNDRVTELKETMSFRRFGILSEEIYCTVEGSGPLYKNTAKKRSNVSNVYFGGVQRRTEKEKTIAAYTIANPRHLYNIRYLEDFTDGERTAMGYPRTDSLVEYRIAKDIDWASFTSGDSYFEYGAGAPGHVSIPAAGPDTFPSFTQLRGDSVLEGEESRQQYTISGLTMNTAANRAAGVYEASMENGGMSGFILINDGIIQNLTLDGVRASGEKQTGAFSAVNRGTMKNLEVNSTGWSGQITGSVGVGALAGDNYGTCLLYTSDAADE